MLEFCTFIDILYSISAYCLITFLQGNTSYIGTFLMAVNKQNQSNVNTLVSTLFIFSIFCPVYVNVFVVTCLTYCLPKHVFFELQITI